MEYPDLVIQIQLPSISFLSPDLFTVSDRLITVQSGSINKTNNSVYFLPGLIFNNRFTNTFIK